MLHALYIINFWCMSYHWITATSYEKIHLQANALYCSDFKALKDSFFLLKYVLLFFDSRKVEGTQQNLSPYT